MQYVGAVECSRSIARADAVHPRSPPDPVPAPRVDDRSARDASCRSSRRSALPPIWRGRVTASRDDPIGHRNVWKDGIAHVA